MKENKIEIYESDGTVINRHDYKGYNIDDYLKITAEKDKWVGYDKTFIPAGNTIIMRLDAYSTLEINQDINIVVPDKYKLSLWEFVKHIDETLNLVGDSNE